MPADTPHADTQPPFAPGEVVLINGFTHLGLQRVQACRWGKLPGTAPECWLCECVDATPDAAPGTTPNTPWVGPAAYLSRHSGDA